MEYLLGFTTWGSEGGKEVSGHSRNVSTGKGKGDESCLALLRSHFHSLAPHSLFVLMRASYSRVQQNMVMLGRSLFCFVFFLALSLSLGCLSSHLRCSRYVLQEALLTRESGIGVWLLVSQPLRVTVSRLEWLVNFKFVGLEPYWAMFVGD